MSNIYNKSILNKDFKGLTLLAVLALGITFSPLSANADGTYSGYSTYNAGTGSVNYSGNNTPTSSYSGYSGFPPTGVFIAPLPSKNSYAGYTVNAGGGIIYVNPSNGVVNTFAGYSHPRCGVAPCGY